LAPPGKFWKNPLVPPSGKNPSDAHDYEAFANPQFFRCTWNQNELSHHSISFLRHDEGLRWLLEIIKASVIISICNYFFKLFSCSCSRLGVQSSSAAGTFPRLEKGVFLPSPRRKHPLQVAVVALVATGLVSIKCRKGRATWRHLPSSPTEVRRSGRITDGMRSCWRTQWDSVLSSPTSAPTLPKWPCQEQHGSGLTACASVSVVERIPPAYTVWPLLQLVSVAQKRPSTMLSSNVQCIHLSMDSFSDVSGWWDNWMAAQHLLRDLLRPSSGLEELVHAMKKKNETHSQEQFTSVWKAVHLYVTIDAPQNNIY